MIHGLVVHRTKDITDGSGRRTVLVTFYDESKSSLAPENIFDPGEEAYCVV